MSETHALVTLYNPSEKEFNNCRILSQQVDTVILCDNSQESHETVFQNEKNIIYITKNENLGLGAAFNVALKNDTYGWKDDDLIIFKRCRMNTGRLRHLFRIWGVWGLYFTIRAMVGRRDHGRRKILQMRHMR